MKKIIIQPIAMSDMAKNGKTVYRVSSGKFGPLSGPVYYSLSGVMEQNLTKDDDVKVISIVSTGGTEKSQVMIADNTEKCHQEFLELKNKTGCKMSTKDIAIPYDIKNSYYEKMFSQIISEIDENSELYVDITLGDRFIPVFIFSIVQFAEQCLNCKLKIMTWAKRGYDEFGNVLDNSYLLTDITSIYYLNKITSTLHTSDGKAAIKTVQDFLSL